MVKKILLILLVLSLLLECYLTYLCFFNPADAFKSMQLQYSEELAFPAYLIGWFLLLITLLIGYLIYAVAKNQVGIATVIYILALWWIGIGVGIYLYNGTTTNLLSDSLKGLLLLVLTGIWMQKMKVES